jgi:glutamate racemase
LTVASVTKRVSVLGTEATVKREYTHALIRDHAQGCEVDLVGSKQLAAYAEAELRGRPASDMELRAEIEPCFRDDGRRTDTIVLACTHYPLLTERLRHIAPWPVSFIDPAPAIARRVVQLLGEAPAAREARMARAFFSSGKAPAAILARFGLTPGNVAPLIDPASPA